MSTSKRLTEVFESAKEISFDDTSKFIFFSDTHRGDNSWADDFSHNQSLFFHALEYYFDKGFTYIELGDGDELWENKKFADIRSAHSHVFWLMRKFYNDKRLYRIFGNHDIEWKYPQKVKKALYRYFEERTNSYEPLFDGIEVYEGLILKHSDNGLKLFLVHGHQGDLFSDRFWRVGRFFVRHFWRHLQLFGVNDPTSPAKNYKKRGKVETKITEWVKANGQVVIAGHTHRSVFPKQEQPHYFNDGSAVHPRAITGIEIQSGEIVLIKWWIRPKGGMLYIDREVLAGPRKLQEFAKIT